MGMTRANKVPLLLGLLGASFVLAFATSCSNPKGTGGPSLKSVALHRAPGGTAFPLDLKTFVTDSTQTATYSVLSGGGSFTGSVYSRAFPTLGTYSVSYEVRDFRNNVARASFDVKVSSAQLALVRNGNGLSLLDVQTSNLVAPIQNDGRTKVYKGALANGSVVLEVTQSAQTDLWLHNPNVAATVVFAADSSLNETFVGVTSDNKIVYERGATPSRTIWLYDPATTNTTAISAVVTGGGPRDEYGARIQGRKVYFTSSLTSGGNADVWYYDLDTSSSTAISTHAEAESLVATLANGGVVWTRNGASSEKDLLYWNGSTVQNIGADLGTNVNLESMVFQASTTDSRVIFETTDSGGDEDLYIWNPVGPASTAIATSSVDETYVATTPTGRIVYKIATGVSNDDLSWFAPATSTGGTIANSSNNEVYNGSCSTGDVIFSAAATGLDLYHWVQATTTASAFPNATSTSTDYVFGAVLDNDDVVYTVGDDLSVYTPSTTSSASITTSTGTESFAGKGKDAGDFVISLVNGSVTSLYFWDKSATTAVAIQTTGVSSFEATAPNGTVLFSRIAPSDTQKDLWTFVPTTSTAVQVTTATTDESVDAVVSAQVD